MTEAPELLPCPFCGFAPLLDYGLSDAPFEEPFVWCAAIHLGAQYESCAENPASPVSSETLSEWNHRALAVMREMEL